MILTSIQKEEFKNEIVSSLRSQTEIERIIVFGSFLKDQSPSDIDIAIFQNSKEKYLSLAMKYRKMIRNISKRIAVDIIPIKCGTTNSFVESEIESGEVIYDKGN